MTEIVEIEHHLTDEEKIQMGAEMSAFVKEHDELETERKEVAAVYGAKLKSLMGKISSRARILNDGFYHENVECDFEYDYRNKEVVYYFAGTKTEAHRRDMTPDEFQQPLDGM
jgi:hypothetical protein